MQSDFQEGSYVLRYLRDLASQTGPKDSSNSTKGTRLIPLLVARVCTSLGVPKPKDATILLDSGASSVHGIVLQDQ